MNQVIDKALGLVYDVSSPELAIEALLDAQNMAKSLEQTTKEIKKHLVDHDKYEHKNYMVRYSATQRQNYNKGKLRELVDDDLFDIFTFVKKGAVDKWLKESIARGDPTPPLKSILEAEGDPYTSLRLVKVTREEAQLTKKG